MVFCAVLVYNLRDGVGGNNPLGVAMTIQEFYEKWLDLDDIFGEPDLRMQRDLRALIRHYGGNPKTDTLTRTEK